MANLPWKGAARPRSAHVMRAAATALRCEEAAIRAVFEAEAAGAGFLSDGTLKRRFEPHHMPGSEMTWREAFKIKPGRREALFLEAFDRDPEAALRATSWGLPQIMGFNHGDAGFGSAREMVKAMAQGEDFQISAFTALVIAWGLDSAIRAHDWHEFERRYNGGGQGGAYARKMEKLYRKHSGRASAEVLRLGSSGANVTRLQAALGIVADGDFGPATKAAVEAFQTKADLPADGIVGARTWAALEAAGTKPAKVQATPGDALLDRAEDALRKGGLGAGAGFTGRDLLDRVPQGAIEALTYGAVALALLYALTLILRRLRRAAR
ncbi:DUF3380 domain-containing protein [Mameliella alba]|uniref:N-acetylmuramidase domain-containing protein n=1 Tax=Mameliella alba TaxID=561184 RepID=UPI001C97E22B|nr:N-acetylmuramidase domain-containing protein [Mameliella alba]MBY6121801.1 DUF3380 domain-containing protein [Mameliella alba]